MVVICAYYGACFVLVICSLWSNIVLRSLSTPTPRCSNRKPKWTEFLVFSDIFSNTTFFCLLLGGGMPQRIIMVYGPNFMVFLRKSNPKPLTQFPKGYWDTFSVYIGGARNSQRLLHKRTFVVEERTAFGKSFSQLNSKNSEEFGHNSDSPMASGTTLFFLRNFSGPTVTWDDNCEVLILLNKLSADSVHPT